MRLLPSSTEWGQGEKGIFHPKTCRVNFSIVLTLLFIVGLGSTALCRKPVDKLVLKDASGEEITICLNCDNVQNGGLVVGDEFGCPSPEWDPSPILNVELPTGGSGALEFLWIYTTDDPNDPFSQWTPIPNSNAPDYDPGPISVTTYFRRCARRAGCSDYVGESNIIIKEAICCDNVLDGGEIGLDQTTCSFPFDPDLIGEISAPQGGTGALEFQWVMSTTGTPYDPSNPDWVVIPGANSPTYDPDTLFQNTYFIRLAKRHGCVEYVGISNMVSVYSVNTLQIDTLESFSPTCFNGSDGSINLAVTGGTPPYFFQWSPHGGNVEDPTGLAPGTYYLTVSDAEGCEIYDSIEVDNPAPMDVHFTAVRETCLGANDGHIHIDSISQGQAPFSYQWNDPSASSSSSIFGLAPGTYTVTITDARGCTTVVDIEVPLGNALQLQLSSMPPSCFGEMTGSASVDQITGGTPPYTYAWDDPAFQQSATAIGLGAGTYTVIVTDSLGCVGVDSVTLDEGAQLLTTMAVSNASCFNSHDGSATVSVNGGQAPYQYSWDDPSHQSTENALNLPPGTFTVTVTDANGCSAIDTAVIDGPAPIILQLASVPVSCPDAHDGSVSVQVVSPTGGVFSFQWDDPSSSTSAHVSGLGAGTYTVTVTDETGCSESASVTVGSPPGLNLDFIITPASCPNSSDGYAEVVVSGGTPDSLGNYSYLWNAPGNPAVASLDDIAPGTYQVTVTDSRGCSAVGTVQIPGPSPMAIAFEIDPISCFGAADGGLAVTVAGGTAPYTYSWGPPIIGGSPSVTGLAAGEYTLTVTDANGCISSASINIFDPEPLGLTIQSQDVLCQMDSNGTATALASGGTQPYHFNWSNGQTTQTASGLVPGNYTVTVTDDHGCQVTGSVSIEYSSDLLLITSATDVNCYGGSDGQAGAIASGGVLPYSYLWSNGASTSQVSGLASGTYVVTVTDGAGCSLVADVLIGEPAVLNCSAAVVSPITTHGGNDGVASASASGGVYPYQFSWDNGSTIDTAFNLGAGQHTVTVTDSNGCNCVTHVSLNNPSKIGNFIWNDLDQDGVQDPNEPGIGGVFVQLTGNTFGGNPVNMNTTSDSAGFYAFDGLAAGFYTVHFGLVPNAVYTKQDQGSDLLDSDADPNTGATAGFPLASGYYNQTIDCGLIILDEKVDVGDRVWLDTNRNGIQDPGEGGIQGVTVRLRSVPGDQVIATTVTDQLGTYRFKGVIPGDYYIEFMLNSLPNGYLVSPKDQGGDDTKDSDADPLTGKTATFTVAPFTLDMLHFDMGAYKECDNVTDGGLIGYDEELCGLGSDPTEIVNVQLPTGGFGTIEYLWLSSSIPIYNGLGDPNWTPIPNSNSPNYDPGPLSQSTYFIRCSRRQGCTEYFGESNVVSKIVTPYPLTQIIDEPGTLCENQGGRFEAAIAGGGATYFWEFEGGTPATANSRVVNDVTWATPGLKDVTLTVTRFGCSRSISTTVQVNNCFQPLIVINDLQGSIDGNSIEITWHVNGRVDDVIQFVERSEDGVQFQTIGVVGKQHMLPGGWFEVVDAAPALGENNYRIRYKSLSESDMAGTSETISVFYQPEDMGLSAVYPNPTRDILTLELLRPDSNEVKVQIVNPYGQLIRNFTLEAQTDRHELDLSGLRAGVYLLTIDQQGYRTMTHRIVKIE